MPINYKDYHPKWSLIRRLILKRAKHCCEECGVHNYNVIKRINKKEYMFPCSQDWDMIYSTIKYSDYSMNASLKYHGFTKIVLTIAHLDHNKKNNRFHNLKALCQRCHLTLDIHQHINNRKYGRDWKKQQIKMDI